MYQPSAIALSKVGDLAGSNTEQQLQLAEMIETTLTPYLFPANLYNTSFLEVSIGEMVQKNQRCVVLYPSKTHRF